MPAIGGPATYRLQRKYLFHWPLRNLRWLRHAFLMRLLAPLAGFGQSDAEKAKARAAQRVRGIALARERAGDLPCRFAIAQVPPLPAGSFDVVLLLETMLAFEDKDALVREITAVLRPGGRFAFTLEEGPPLTTAERAAMPDADTVWLTPLEELAASLERAGLVVTWQEDHSRAHRGIGPLGDRRGRSRLTTGHAAPASAE